MEFLTDRLRLREIGLDDIEAFHRYQNDPRYLEHYPYDRWDLSQTEKLVQRLIAWSKEKPRVKFQLAIALKTIGEPIGSAGVRCESSDSDTDDIGYELSQEYWGNGYATEAVSALLDFGFRELKLDRVEARCVTANGRSIRLLERLGCEEEERLPAGGMSKGYVWPERSIYVTHRDDWLRRSNAAGPINGY